MCVQVFGQRELESRIRNHKPVYSHLISIGNPPINGIRREDSLRVPLFDAVFDEVLRLEFFDAERRRHLPPRAPKRLITHRDVRKVTRFVRRTKAEATGYTVHCWRGVSRSPAVALAVLYILSGDESEAARTLIKIRRQARPLQRAVRLFDRYLRSDLSQQNDVIREERLAEIRREILSLTQPVSDEDAMELESLDE